MEVSKVEIITSMNKVSGLKSAQSLSSGIPMIL